MNQALPRYHTRAPRYILQAEDNTLIRVAGPHQTPWEEATEISDLSFSGLSFTAPSELCPILGECIKIQFEVPGSKQMACYGMVARLDLSNPTTSLVGVQFIKLELPHRIVLAQSLAKKLKDQNARDAKTQSGPQWKKAVRIFWAGLALSSWLYLIYVLSTIFSKT